MEFLRVTASTDARPPTLSDLMLLLKSELRLDILRCLVESPQSVTDLVNVLELEQSAVSHSLAMLRDHGLVHASRRKKQQIYRLSDNVAQRVSSSLVQLTIPCRHSEGLTVHIQLRAATRPHAQVTSKSTS